MNRNVVVTARKGRYGGWQCAALFGKRGHDLILIHGSTKSAVVKRVKTIVTKLGMAFPSQVVVSPR